MSPIAESTNGYEGSHLEPIAICGMGGFNVLFILFREHQLIELLKSMPASRRYRFRLIFLAHAGREAIWPDAQGSQVTV